MAFVYNKYIYAFVYKYAQVDILKRYLSSLSLQNNIVEKMYFLFFINFIFIYLFMLLLFIIFYIFLGGGSEDYNIYLLK